ncbi:DUF3829 domain-containing protein [Sphingomonas alpina]|uniref:DUF3829 domain-containing protein n=1 Tax=Sphingomonas alpina TaxID=653931 RepID=A0A7H0LGI1_9SPHN|nr:DUF3829 domain-containing protein [Sphingomonas alpina]QNQ08784.1 DUF3829 domain-containing protein [Sphingomonas alpina]
MGIQKQGVFYKGLCGGLAGMALLATAACNDKSSGGNQAMQAGDAGGKQLGDQEAQKKFNTYVKAMNMLIDSGKFEERIAYFERLNPQLKNSAPLTEMYMMNIGVDHIISRLDEAQKMNATIPGVDEKAKALIPVLTQLDTVNTELNTYVSAKEYTVDGGKKGREIAPRYLAALAAARDAQQQFADTTAAYELQRDQAALAKAKPDSLQFHKLTVTLAARGATREFDKINAPGDDTSAFTASLTRLGEVNASLAGFVGKAPKTGAGSLSSDCQRYVDKVNSMIGTGRTFAQTLKSKPADVADDAKDFIEAFNDGVGEVSSCELEDN